MLSLVGESMNLSADYMTLGLAGVFQKPIDRNSLLAVLKARLGR